jgi:hypothetical protein
MRRSQMKVHIYLPPVHAHMCVPTRYPPLSSLRSVPRCPSSPHLRLPHTSARSCSSLLNIPHSLPFRLRICAARAFIRSRPSPPPPASARACGTRPIRRHQHTRALCPSFKHCVCRAAIGEGRGGGRRVESAFYSWIAQRRGGCAAEGRRGRGVSEAGERQVRYGKRRYEAGVEADAEPVDESGVCKAESECGAWRASG